MTSNWESWEGLSCVWGGRAGSCEGGSTVAGALQASLLGIFPLPAVLRLSDSQKLQLNTSRGCLQNACLGGLGGVGQAELLLGQSRDRPAPGKESCRHRGAVST